MKLFAMVWTAFSIITICCYAEVRGTLLNSAVDGVVELNTRSRVQGGSEKHFINAAQIVRVYTKAIVKAEDHSKAATSVVIATSETKHHSHGDGVGSRSMAYVLTYDTDQEASEAIQKVLKEVSVAIGVSAPEGR